MFLPVRQIGRLRPGSLVPTVGLAAEVAAVALAWGQVRVSWKAAGLGARFAVYVDSRLVAVMCGAELVVPSLDGGAHQVSVVAVATSTAPAAIRPEWETGDQALLMWSAVDDPDLTGYRVTDSGGTATDVTHVAVAVADYTPTGSGSGRLRSSGQLIGPVINAAMALTVNSGRLEYVIGVVSGDVAIAEGECVGLPYGLAVTFLDEAAAYVTGDSYSIPLRVATELLTVPLARGTHTFAVAGLTATGVAGSTVSVPVSIPAPDVRLSAFAWSADGTFAFTVSGSHAAGLHVFSNWDGVAGVFLASVDEISPVARVTGLTGTVDVGWDGVTAGTLRVMLGIVTTWGQVVRLVEMQTLVVPEAEAAFGTLEFCSVTQSGTALLVRLAYTEASGDAATAIRVARDSGVLTASVDVAVTPDMAGRVRLVEATVDAADVDGATVTVTAMALNDDVEGDAISMEITLDLHAPVAPAAVIGAPA